MSFFKKKHEQPAVEFAPPATSRVEVELHKNASEKAALKATETNNHLNELLIENGFTLKIYIAAGGRQHKRDGTKK